MAGYLIDQADILERMVGKLLESGHLDESTRLAALQRARRLVTDARTSPEMQNASGPEKWAKLTQMLQDLAYAEPDTGGEIDITSWCEAQWTELLSSHSHNVGAMRGLGHHWLLKAQPVLASIYNREGSPPSKEASSYHLGVSRPRPDPSDSEDTARINSPDYIEARSLLRPSLEYLDRAVEEAELQGTVTGELLQLSAEAYMSFANVSHPRNNEVAYQKALRLLQKASSIEGFIMDPYLEDVLDDNINYIQ